MTSRESSTGLSPRLAAPLAYSGWWVTGLIFWVVERKDPYVRFHAAQAVAVFGVVAVLVLAFCLLAVASISFMPRAFTAFVWAAALTWVTGVGLWIIVLWTSATGRTLRIPVAANLADRLV
jgi:uncharacterized membrane protein